MPELERMATDHRLDEQVHAQLMVALYRSGRQADALSAYQRLRCTLAEELGLFPARRSASWKPPSCGRTRPWMPRPRRSGVRSVAPPAPAAPPQPVPAQLPPPAAAFAGRAAELARLDSILPGPAEGGPADRVGVITALITGTAGVGKTALAVHWAHRVATQFPDGQLYVNLRGFDPVGPALDPSQALRGFLDAFAVVPERIPAGLDGQVGAVP